MYEYDDPIAVFEGLQVMETEALRHLNKGAK
jgi:hypothetical protein